MLNLHCINVDIKNRTSEAMKFQTVMAIGEKLPLSPLDCGRSRLILALLQG